MSITGNIMGKGIFALLDTLVAALSGFLYLILSAMILSKEEYGLFMLSFSIYLFLIFFIDAGIGNAMVKYASEKDGIEFEKVVTNSLYFKLFMAIVGSMAILILSSFISDLLHTPNLKTLMEFLPVLILASVMNKYFKQILQSKLRIKEIFYMDTVGLISLISLFSYFYLSRNLMSAMDVLLMISLSYFLSALTGAYISRDILNFSWKLDKKWMGKLFHFGKYTTLGGMSVIMYTRTDTLMIGYFLNPVAVAEYNAAWVFSYGATLITHAAYTLSFPIASKVSSNKEYKRLKELYEKSIAYSLILIVPLAIILTFFPTQVLYLFYQDKYLNATLVLMILGIWGIVKPFGSTAGSLLNGMGKPHLGAFTDWMGAIGNILLNLLLIPKYGIIGAAFATLLSYISISIIMNLFLRKYVHIKIIDIFIEIKSIIYNFRL